MELSKREAIALELLKQSINSNKDLYDDAVWRCYVIADKFLAMGELGHYGDELDPIFKKSIMTLDKRYFFKLQQRYGFDSAVKNLGQLVLCTEKEVRSWGGFGDKAICDINTGLSKLGLSLDMTVDEMKQFKS